MSYNCSMLKTIESRIKYRISRSKDNVFTPKDFLDISGRDQVGRALRALIKKGVLAKIGWGVYVKTRVCEYTGRTVLSEPLPLAARSGLKKLGVKVVLSQAEADYNERRSTQVPTGRVIGVKGRVSRKFEYNGVRLNYEYQA